jgi:multiple sugar transport system permease protein
VGAELRLSAPLATLAARRRLFFLCCLLPAAFYVLLVAGLPLVQGLWYSLFEYNLLRPSRSSFAGLANYARIAGDPTARAAIVNTFLFTVSAVALELALGLTLALLLWRDRAFERIALALLLIPVSITPLAVGLVFRALLSAEFGYVGYWARDLGLVGERGFFGYPGSAFAAIVLIDVWQWTPLMALILLAGLKAIPQEMLEAAEVDGAGFGRKLRLVILPMLLPAVFLALILRTMDAFRLFDSVYVTTKGGPEDATTVLLFYAVKQGLEFFNTGYASALSALMLACIGLFAAAYIVILRRADRRFAGA